MVVEFSTQYQLDESKEVNMQFKRNLLVCGIVSAFSLPVLASTDELRQALDQSKVNTNFRYRIESVDQDNLSKDALASTLRSRLSVQTGAYSGFSAFVELDNVTVLGDDSYNSTVNGETAYPVVADPDGSDLNQAFLRYQTASKQTNVDMGRQRINLLNQRFLGSVGWRQNEQTLDGFRVQHTTATWLVDASRLHNVNRVFGPDGAKADEPGEFVNLLVGFKPNAQHQISVFAHDYQFDNWAARSSLTTGLDYLGNFVPANQQQLQLHLAYATQTDNSDSVSDFSEDYSRIDVLWKINKVSLEAGYELLSGDGTTALQTPLATLHAFNGFADIFLATPVNGLNDVWFGAGYTLPKGAINLQYHQYSSDLNDIDYGDEINLNYTYNISTRLMANVKLAQYNRDQFAQDTQKIWVGLQLAL